MVSRNIRDYPTKAKRTNKAKHRIVITSFEQQTAELNDKELEIIPFLIKGFSSHSEDNPIKAPVIVRQMNDFLAKNNKGIKMNEPRLRKCVNYIRSNSILPLIATSDGYYVSQDHEVIKSQIKSLRERASSISKCADGLSVFIPTNNL